MILLVGVAAGLAAALLRYWITGKPYQTPGVRWPALVPLAFLPQYLAFIHPTIRTQLPDEWAPFLLVGSQALLLIWALVNLRHSPYRVLSLGLALNFLVIVANGGLMPIRPEMVQALAPDAPAGAWQIGERLGWGKDIVLPLQDTRLWFLSDYFLLPEWLGRPVAFSLGDVVLAVGAFYLLFLGKIPEDHHEKTIQTHRTVIANGSK